MYYTSRIISKCIIKYSRLPIIQTFNNSKISVIRSKIQSERTSNKRPFKVLSTQLSAIRSYFTVTIYIHLYVCYRTNIKFNAAEK